MNTQNYSSFFSASSIKFSPTIHILFPLSTYFPICNHAYLNRIFSFSTQYSLRNNNLFMLAHYHTANYKLASSSSVLIVDYPAAFARTVHTVDDKRASPEERSTQAGRSARKKRRPSLGEFTRPRRRNFAADPIDNEDDRGNARDRRVSRPL